MKLVNYFVNLRLYQKENNLPDSFHITIHELGEILCCSERNIKLLLKRMSGENWLKWQPGRGRGHKSALTFTKDIRMSLVEVFQIMLEKEELTEAIELLKENLPEEIKEEMHHLLNSHFGYQDKESGTTRDVLKIPMTRKLSTLDPAFVSVSSESHFARQIYDTLLQYDEVEKRFQPHLAHSYDVAEDGKVITFYLRKGIMFHNSKPMTAKDVLYTFQRLTNQEINSPCQWQTALVLEVKCLDSYTIQFFLKRRTRMFLHFISSISMAIVPDDGTKWIGTGPFSVGTFTDDVLILETFLDYFKERAWLDQIEIWRIPANSKVDLHYELPEGKDNTRDGAVDFLQVGSNYITFNLNKKSIVHDWEFRNAVYHLFDIEKMIRELGKDRLLAATSLFPEKSLKHPPAQKSLQQAFASLESSGYRGETIKISFFDMKFSHEDASWLQERAEKIGLKLELHPFPLNDYYKEHVTADSDMIIMGEMFENNVVLAFINFFKHKASFVNRFLAGEEEAYVQQLVDCLMDEEDERIQYEIMDEIEQYLYEKRLLLNSYHIYRKKSFPLSLKNVSMNSFGWADFRKLWVKPDLKR
ncbi:SgrR family transcriptional regulator [Fictibacillus nanhaiensis]|uniref:ABC transporter substrate-binding protein n=1 Tax=Fictibacillus nanhaiensis TaxID=742169 RepID=UPI001C95F198|nr:ABC transporter substrate-binding protein [Fictibacillus nanhaiensis]MBY6036494.1 SgrR family transcriptional regulator [Fictibacillus nanhaiensis]